MYHIVKLMAVNKKEENLVLGSSVRPNYKQKDKNKTEMTTASFDYGSSLTIDHC